MLGMFEAVRFVGLACFVMAVERLGCHGDLIVMAGMEAEESGM
jgi:hypothetical protein